MFIFIFKPAYSYFNIGNLKWKCLKITDLFFKFASQAFLFLFFFYSPVGLAKDIHVTFYIHAWGLIKRLISVTEILLW
jgi:hypothetical protein